MDDHEKKRPASTTPGSSGKRSPKSTKTTTTTMDPERRRVMAEIVTRSRLDCSLRLLEPEERQATIESWERLLESVPTARLDASYTQAMKNHTRVASDGPFKAGLILAAYQQLVQQHAFDTTQKQIDAEHMTREELRSFVAGLRQEVFIKDPEARSQIKHAADSMKFPRSPGKTGPW